MKKYTSACKLLYFLAPELGPVVRWALHHISNSLCPVSLFFYTWPMVIFRHWSLLIFSRFLWSVLYLLHKAERMFFMGWHSTRINPISWCRKEIGLRRKVFRDRDCIGGDGGSLDDRHLIGGSWGREDKHLLGGFFSPIKTFKYFFCRWGLDNEKCENLEF